MIPNIATGMPIIGRICANNMFKGDNKWATGLF